MPVPLTSSSICCNNNMELKARAGTIFRNCEKSSDGNPGKVIKVPLKTNTAFINLEKT